MGWIPFKHEYLRSRAYICLSLSSPSSSSSLPEDISIKSGPFEILVHPRILLINFDFLVSLQKMYLTQVCEHGKTDRLDVEMSQKWHFCVVSQVLLSQWELRLQPGKISHHIFHVPRRLYLCSSFRHAPIFLLDIKMTHPIVFHGIKYCMQQWFQLIDSGQCQKMLVKSISVCPLFHRYL